MGAHQPVQVDPKEVKRAEEMWEGFTQLLKWSIMATVGILAVLGLLFIDW